MLMVMPTVRRCRSIQLFARLEKVRIRIDRIQRFKVYAWRLVPPPGPACSAVYNSWYASRARGSHVATRQTAHLTPLLLYGLSTRSTTMYLGRICRESN